LSQRIASGNDRAGLPRGIRWQDSEAMMVQTTNRFFDEVARLMNDTAGVAQGVRREFETLFRSQAERFLSNLDVVKREEFEAVKDMARIAREENEALKARVAALEAALAKTGTSAATPSADTPSGTAFSTQAPDVTTGPINPGTF
jgi:BMFP domain-containing protein YqiC